MSQIYVLEPPTSGKVLLKTDCGDIEIELWSKEAPKACRNFVQLCMEGFYDNTIFHRIVKNFCIQGGDPTGSGEGIFLLGRLCAESNPVIGGESVYGRPFEDEYHSRLRFSHRGIVASAGPQNQNQSQFFITLDKCEDINRKHTIFGKVSFDIGGELR